MLPSCEVHHQALWLAEEDCRGKTSQGLGVRGFQQGLSLMTVEPLSPMWESFQRTVGETSAQRCFVTFYQSQLVVDVWLRNS